MLRELGVLHYSPALAAAVDGRQQLTAGGPEEVEVRASTVAAVERIKHALRARLAAASEEQQGGEAPELNSVLLDWWLWEVGERNIAQHRPHHRTLTTFY